MTAVDIWAVSAAGLAGSCIAIRSRMLRPNHGTWTGAPMLVWAGLSALGLGLMMAAVAIWFGAHATPREAMVYSLLAVNAASMLWNLNRNGRKAAVDEAEFKRQVDMAWKVAPGVANYHLNAMKGDPGRGEGR